MEALFICQRENGELFCSFKADIDAEIKLSEQNDEDLDFKVIGKIKGVHLTKDLAPAAIEWFESGKKDKAFVDKAVLQIVQFLG